MSTYKFGAEPRVVKNKAKYRGGGPHEETVKKLKTPLEMAEDAIKSERERRKIDLLKEQLIQFKRNKTKQTPYDLRPAPPPKIEVDLTYFLTEQNVQPPAIDVQNIQTDAILSGPPEPPYIPQKKGVDVSTEILDDDLFDFDREVEPILHVLTSKTLEQACLEVDEAAEIEAIHTYKSEFNERRKAEKEDWETQIQKEMAKLTKKNQLLDREREKRQRRDTAVRKLQCIHLAKAYLRNTLHNSLASLLASNHWPNAELEHIKTLYVPSVVGQAAQVGERKTEIKKSVHALGAEALVGPTKLAGPIRETLKEKLREKHKPRVIEDPRYRQVRIMFYNIVKPKSSKYGFYVRKALAGKLEEWEKEVKENYGKLHDRYFAGEENVEELIGQYNQQLTPTATEFMLDVQSYKTLALCVASDPYECLSEQHRRYKPEVYLYRADGSFCGKRTEESGDAGFGAFLRFEKPERDRALKENDEYKLAISLQGVPAEVAMVILAVKEEPLHKTAKEAWYANARYRLLDEETYQSVEFSKLDEVLEKAQKLSEVPSDEASPDGRLVLCGRLFKDDKTAKWTYEAYKLGLSGKMPDLEKKMAGLSDILKREEMPAIDLAKWEEEHAQQIATAAKGKGRSKREEPKAGKSRSKIEDEKKSKTQKEEDKDEEKDEDVESIESRLEGILNFPIGPLNLDCGATAADIEAKIMQTFAEKHKDIHGLCTHGLEIYLKDRLLKNPKQILRYAHLLPHFILRPKVPEIIPPAALAPPEKEEGQEGKEEQIKPDAEE